MTEQETTCNDMDELIENQQWDAVSAALKKNPDAARRIVDESRGWTLLHSLASMGSTPSALIRQVASLYPEAIVMTERRYGDTPLHYICRNSLTSETKLIILLNLIPRNSKALLTRNHFGGTPLHSASNHNAVLPALKALVRANDQIIKVKTHQGVHAVSALWHAYIQTIQGLMCVARIKQGEEVSERHFERFWAKVEYLALEHFRRTPDWPPGGRIAPKSSQLLLLHALLRCNAPDGIIQVALKRNPAYATKKDATGSLPLHWLLENRPYRLKEKKMILALLRAAPEAASIPNTHGDVPIQIAIRNKIPWENGVAKVLEACPSVVSRKDSTGLVPFQQAASVGGRVSVETTYHLLVQQPDLCSSNR